MAISPYRTILYDFRFYEQYMSLCCNLPLSSSHCHWYDTMFGYTSIASLGHHLEHLLFYQYSVGTLQLYTNGSLIM